MRVTKEAVSWEDAANWLEEITKEHHRKYHIICSSLVHPQRGPYWVFTLWSWTGQAEGKYFGLLYEEMRWPNSRFVSVPALIIGLARAHCRRLEMMTTEAEQRAFF